MYHQQLLALGGLSTDDVQGFVNGTAGKVLIAVSAEGFGVGFYPLDRQQDPHHD